MKNAEPVIRNFSRRGQTLVEAIVALTILTTGFLGIATLLTKSFQLNRITSEDTQATYLASEGIELAKNIIDYDVYSGLAGTGSGWGCSFGLAIGASADYELVYSTVPPVCDTAIAKSFTAGTDPLYYHTDTGFYDYTGGANSVKSNFTRKITITAVSNY